MSQLVTLMETVQHISEEEVVPTVRSLSLPHCHLSQDRPIEMSSKPSRTKVKPPQMLIKETLSKTKKLFHKTFRNVKSFMLVKNQEQQQPTSTSVKPTFHDKKMDNTKLQELDSFYKCYSEKWDSIEVKKKKETQISQKVLPKKDEHISTRSISFANCRGLNDSKEDKKARKYSGRDKKEVSFKTSAALAQKMKDLEMMDVNDMDHVLDVEEVLHYYSRLNCPSYVDIVDKFFTDMYSEFHAPQPSSRSGSMRKLGAASSHGSMRSIGPIKV